MADIVSRGEIFITAPGVGANKLLERVSSIDVKDGRTTEVVMAIGVERGAGFRRKQGGFEIDAEVYKEMGRNPEVDWFDLNNRYITFTITTVDEGDGWRYSYVTKISNIDEKKDAEGNFMMTIKMVCTTVDRT